MDRIQEAGLKALETQIRMVREAQKAHGGDLDELKKLSDQAGGLARALAAILAEGRKQVDTLKQRIKKMSQDEKVDLLKAFLDELAIDQRRAVRQYLDSFEDRL